MSIQKDGFLSYSELLTYERRARELRGEAIRAGVASLFGLNKRDRANKVAK
ncbi:MAG: RSP_7527 family protein [Alphaproteobacteria bacterium]